VFFRVNYFFGVLTAAGEKLSLHARAEPPKAKKAKRSCHFDNSWIKEFPGIGVSSRGISTKFIAIQSS